MVVYDLATGRFLRAVGSADVLSSPISVAIRKAAGGGQPEELWVVEFKGHEARDPPDRRYPVPCHKTPVHSSPTLSSPRPTGQRARLSDRRAAAHGRPRREGRGPAGRGGAAVAPHLPSRLHLARSCRLAYTSPAPRPHRTWRLARASHTPEREPRSQPMHARRPRLHRTLTSRAPCAFGQGYLSEPRDLAFTGDEVVVTDLTNHRAAPRVHTVRACRRPWRPQPRP